MWRENGSAKFEHIRDPEVAHSEFGQHIHDNLPRTFFAIDIDIVIFKKATRILRILEEKRPGQNLKPSQQVILSLLAKGIAFLADCGLVDKDSGVFVCFGAPPYETMQITQVGGEFDETLSKDALDRFLSGERVLAT